jgi:hypothetical protein
VGNLAGIAGTAGTAVSNSTGNAAVAVGVDDVGTAAVGAGDVGAGDVGASNGDVGIVAGNPGTAAGNGAVGIVAGTAGTPLVLHPPRLAAASYGAVSSNGA